MEMTAWVELLAVVGSFVGAAFAVVRISLRHSAETTSRFVSFLEQAILRQEAINEGFRDAVDRLTACVRENSLLLHRLAERLQPLKAEAPSQSPAGKEEP